MKTPLLTLLFIVLCGCAAPRERYEPTEAQLDQISDREQELRIQHGL